MNNDSKRSHNGWGKLALGALAIVVVTVVATVFIGGRLGSGSWAGEYEVTVVSIPDAAPLDSWTHALMKTDTAATEIEANLLQNFHGRRTYVAYFSNALQEALLRATLTAGNGREDIAVAVVCTSEFDHTRLQQFRELAEFARRNNVRLLPVTNNAATAGCFLTAVPRASNVPWIMVVIFVGGAFGGVLRSLTHAITYTLTLPGRGETVETGYWGHVAIGAAAAPVLVALSVKGFGLELAPLFRSIDEAEGLMAWIHLMSVSIVGGYLGIVLLDRVSDEVVNKIGQVSKNQKLQEAANLALNAKAIYLSLPDNPVAELLEQVATAAKRSNAIAKNALATSMLAEVERIGGRYDQALGLYNEAVALLPDKNIFKPETLYFNRACLRSLLKVEPNELVADLKVYLAAPGADKGSLKTDSDFVWARQQPAFQKAFPDLTEPKTG